MQTSANGKIASLCFLTSQPNAKHFTYIHGCMCIYVQLLVRRIDLYVKGRVTHVFAAWNPPKFTSSVLFKIVCCAAIFCNISRPFDFEFMKRLPQNIHFARKKMNLTADIHVYVNMNVHAYT